MRKADIKPGVVYAYQRVGCHPLDDREPLVFLDADDFGKGLTLGHTLWREPNHGGHSTAFVPAGYGYVKPRVETVYNTGSIGYPAALLPLDIVTVTGRGLAALRALTMDDFRRAGSTFDIDRGVQFLVVTSMARVAGPWED